jgi:hypothetical protein
MKNSVKILIHGLPPGLESALREKAPASWEITAGETPAAPPDVLLTAGGLVIKTIDGVPVITLAAGETEKLTSLLRRIDQAAEQPALYAAPFRIGPYTCEPQEKILRHDNGAEISMTDRETDILIHLARRKGHPAGREILLKKVWRYQEGVDTHTLETHVYRLRQKIGQEDILITEEEGYRLRME